jgi:hypothetical protein
VQPLFLGRCSFVAISPSRAFRAVPFVVYRPLWNSSVKQLQKRRRGGRLFRFSHLSLSSTTQTRQRFNLTLRPLQMLLPGVLRCSIERAFGGGERGEDRKGWKGGKESRCRRERERRRSTICSLNEVEGGEGRGGREGEVGRMKEVGGKRRLEAKEKAKCRDLSTWGTAQRGELKRNSAERQCRGGPV